MEIILEKADYLLRILFCLVLGLNIVFHFFVFWKAYHKSLKQKKKHKEECKETNNPIQT